MWKCFERLKALFQCKVGFVATRITGKIVRAAHITGRNPAASPPALIIPSLFQGGPAGDLEQIDSYLEALLKEDNLLFQNTLNQVTIDPGRSLPLEKKWKHFSQLRVRSDIPF